MDDSSFGDARGPGPFEGKSPSRDVKPSGDSPSSRSPLSVPREPEGPKRPRPDGPNMDVYKTRACSVALEALAGDASVAPRTRALAGAVQHCDAKSDHYDLRHAPCSLFQSAEDDRAVDASIQELRSLAPVCNGPT